MSVFVSKKEFNFSIFPLYFITLINFDLCCWSIILSKVCKCSLNSWHAATSLSPLSVVTSIYSTHHESNLNCKSSLVSHRTEAILTMFHFAWFERSISWHSSFFLKFFKVFLSHQDRVHFPDFSLFLRQVFIVNKMQEE